MKKRNISILSLNNVKSHGLWHFIKPITLLLILYLSSILSCGEKEGVGSRSKTNSPPVIGSVNILPEKPNRENELNLIIKSNDPDGDSITYQYQWMKNDEEIVGENKSTLKSGNFRKGDILQVKVTPSDGKENGKPFLSPEVKIFNSPPVIQEVWIEPKMPTARDDLKGYEKSVDADGDSIYFTYQWEKNGVILTEERKEVLERGKFKKGDSISVAITPDDRETLGSPKKSGPVIISNGPPMIVSSPPSSIEKSRYLYQVRVDDPDNDPITFTLRSKPKGMKIDPNTGLIQWEIQREDRGTHSIEIEVSDNEGAKSIQQYTLTVEFR